jgi:hypothetical protein
VALLAATVVEAERELQGDVAREEFNPPASWMPYE